MWVEKTNKAFAYRIYRHITQQCSIVYTFTLWVANGFFQIKLGFCACVNLL